MEGTDLPNENSNESGTDLPNEKVTNGARTYQIKIVTINERDTDVPNENRNESGTDLPNDDGTVLNLPNLTTSARGGYGQRSLLPYRFFYFHMY